MLPKKFRLTGKKDFDQVKEKGKKFSGSLFGILVLPTKYKFSRFGFIFSTKITKKATERNRARRLLREAVHQVLSRIQPGWDIVFLGRKALLGKSLTEAAQELERILQKAKIFNA